ncbi:hypothetical protein MMC10_000768 [Thelotrema lepadinum]|nr:hypothetical protein [Thelotrema lepadinum]
MVRVKHRYLLLHILYPSPSPPSSCTQYPATSNPPSAHTKENATLSIRRPTPPSLTPNILLNLLRDAISDLFGDWGIGVCKADLMVKYLSPLTSTAIIRCPRDHYRLVWAALSLFTSLPLPTSSSHFPSSHHQSSTSHHYSSKRGGRRFGTERLECVIKVVHVSGSMRNCERAAIRVARGEMGRVRAEPGEGLGLGGGLGGGTEMGIESNSEGEGLEGEGEGEDIGEAVAREGIGAGEEDGEDDIDMEDEAG